MSKRSFLVAHLVHSRVWCDCQHPPTAKCDERTLDTGQRGTHTLPLLLLPHFLLLASSSPLSLSLSFLSLPPSSTQLLHRTIAHEHIRHAASAGRDRDRVRHRDLCRALVRGPGVLSRHPGCLRDHRTRDCPDRYPALETHLPPLPLPPAGDPLARGARDVNGPAGEWVLSRLQPACLGRASAPCKIPAASCSTLTILPHILYIDPHLFTTCVSHADKEKSATASAVRPERWIAALFTNTLSRLFLPARPPQPQPSAAALRG